MKHPRRKVKLTSRLASFFISHYSYFFDAAIHRNKIIANFAP